MLSPKNAYLLFLKYKPDSPAESISEWYDGKSYFIPNSKDDDFVDESYLIDKTTGNITELEFDEYLETIQNLSEKELDNSTLKTWRVKELLSSSF